MTDFKWPARTLTVFDADGNALATEASKSNAQRTSARAAADQKQLDGMAARHPAAVKAKIDRNLFMVCHGVSCWTGCEPRK